MSSAASESSDKKRRNLLVLLPLLAFLALAALFLVRLYAGDPGRLPSALIGHPAPKTDLPPLAGLSRDGKDVPGLTNASFPGELTLVNVWASWCVPCADEVPFLDKLSKDKRIRLVGINYKDPTDNARRFLNRYGNPFVAVGVDASGRTAIDWGVYGVPETYLIGRDGTIAYKLVGPVTAENLVEVLEPEIAKAAAKTATR
ncbi:MAG TPA: DsbE family thiol:disulfide interchange protein [Pseudolabrys sp.]|jgi:cytochrome c biogenesis protein CcmG/thiol:disulfide interchange protein DsbE